MTANQFEDFWAYEYSLTPPISHFLKEAYPDRWFRIHSLPESKRYPENDCDWNILLERQNILLDDLLETSSRVMLVTGEFVFGSVTDIQWEFIPHEALFHLPFTRLKPISLDTLDYDSDTIYRPAFSLIKWQSRVCDDILKAIADDTLRVLFISKDSECIIAPYDGGIDIILKNETIRDIYRAKYRDWLPVQGPGS